MQRSAKKIVFGLALALVVSITAALPAVAAGGGKTTGVSTGVCNVADTVVGGQYTIYGSGFKAGELLNVDVTDSAGTTVLMPPVDSSGAFTTSSYASWSGTYKVSIYDVGGRKPVYLTGCSFQVN